MINSTQADIPELNVIVAALAASDGLKRLAAAVRDCRA